jgi:membrane protein
MRSSHTGNRTDERESGSTRRDSWADILKAMVVVRIAGAAQRVLARRAATPEAGRLGGQTSTAVAPGPAPQGAAARSMSKGKASKPEEAPTPQSGIVPIAQFVFKEFGKDNGSLLAAAVAFYLLLSVIPLMLVGVSALGYVLGRGENGVNPQAVSQVMGFVDQLVPIQEGEIRQWIEKLIQERSSIGLVGLAGVALTATGGFATLENAINAMWNRPNRNFIMNKLFAFMMMLIVGALFLLSFGVTGAVQWAGRIPGLEWLAGNWMLQVLGHVVPVLITSVMFAFIYKFYPNGRTGWKSSLTSGVITAVLWEAFKVGYTFYTSHGSDKSPYGVVIGLVMWIFYSATLVLLGSELTWVLEGRPGAEGKDAVQAQRGR